MKFSLSSFLFTALLVPSTEVKGACTWEPISGKGISGGFAGGTVADQFSYELAIDKCLELGMLVCKAVSCESGVNGSLLGCSVMTGDTTVLDYDYNSFLPSADCVALDDRWNIGAVTASNAASVYSFQYADMSRLWLGVDTAAKITATIYGEFCMVDEFLDTCNWTVESGNKIAPGDPALKESYADGYMFPLTLVEAQVKCLDLGDSLCNAVTCLSDDNGLCTVRFYDSSTLSFEAGVSGDTSYGLPSNHNTADCALKPSAKEESYTFPRPFSDPSLTWTNTEIIESVDSKGDTVFTPTPGDDLFLQYTVSGDPKGMAASEIPDPEYGTSPELKFCVRLGLYADTCADTCATCANPDPTCVVSEEINFFESVVTVTISFDGNFEVLGIGVAPKEQGQTSAAVVYTASAELCGATAEAGNGGKTATEYGQAVKVDNNFNQGAAIMVCISLDDAAKVDDVEINQIKSFIWTQETAGSTPKTQVGIDADGLAGNGLTIQSPIQNSPVGTENVIVTSVLFAAFYEEVGSVKASGEVEMSFARRRRLGTTDNRRLQEADPIAAFDVDATLNKADDGPVAIQQTAGGNGGTYSISNVVGVAITSIVGLLVSDSVLFA
mmetsp:Transcript_11385/g.12781  ORF Transcript_11385/g.12781 Transcript_11385/m.12781 type:complete len:611 (+) Transcript_11385:118-1950(+)